MSHREVQKFLVLVDPERGTPHVHKRRDRMIPVSMQVGQSFTITLAPIPTNGVLDVPPTYTADNPGVVQIAPAVDGLSAKVTAVAVGPVTISVAGVSLGVSITGDSTVVVTVASAQVPATGLHVTVSTPV